MEYYDLIATRYSVRKYKPDAVEPEKIQRILGAGRLAPTAANRQPFGLIICQTAGKQETLRKVYQREWFVNAPMIIAACAVHSEAWVRSTDRKTYVDVDVAIVMDHVILAATNEGLGTCWVAAFNPEEARRMLELPADVEPIVLSPLGYPDDQPKPKERKPLNALVYRERWGGT